jgi:hypothetical protein
MKTKLAWRIATFEHSGVAEVASGPAWHRTGVVNFLEIRFNVPADFPPYIRVASVVVSFN